MDEDGEFLRIMWNVQVNKGMLIVSFEGGLGNQMFQYAFYKALLKQYSDSDVVADFSYINPKMHNGYELNHVFGISMKESKLTDVAKLSERCPKGIKGYRLWNLLYAVRRYLCGFKNSYIRQENSTGYYPEVFQLNTLYSYYFKGVWANEKYFKHIADELQKEFVFEGEISEQNREWIRLIENSESVSIHLRAGDYFQVNYDICDKAYYEKAIAYIKARVKHPVFYVFSDDISMAKEILSFLKDVHYVDNNIGVNSFRDMQLISKCKHNIMANSTFSFWGAYLNTNKNKIVIGTKHAVGSCKAPYEFEGVILI